MEYENEQQRRLAILKAAAPYAGAASQHAIEIVLQAESLANLIHTNASSMKENTLETAQLHENTPDLSGMLKNIQGFLTPKESDTIQTILNFMNARQLFKNYREFAREREYAEDSSQDMVAASLPNESNPFQLIFQLINGLGALSRNFTEAPNTKGEKQQNSPVMDFLLSQLNPEQKNTFEQLQRIMYNKES